jgi:crotonobetainyl-CoA:carnitine CoA-transferase CaiB-like acyl-CoA transferase
MGNAHPNIVPYAVYPAADGHIIIATGNDRQFRDAMAAIDAPEIAAEPAYATNPQRIAARAVIEARIAAATSKLPRDEMLRRLEALKVPAGPINSIADVFAGAQAKARGLKVELPAPHARGGTIPTVRGPIMMDGAPLVAERPSPELDADRAGVLADPAWGGAG